MASLAAARAVRQFVALCAISGLGGCAASPAPEPAPGGLARTVMLVRHAEKRTDDAIDPALSEAGLRRAQALLELLTNADVTHLFATEYRRTRATLEPLAAVTGLEIRTIEAGQAAAQAAALWALPPGSLAVVAGHANTLPELAIAVGGQLERLTPTRRGDWLGDDEHDRLFVLILPPVRAEPVRTIELRYGD